MLTFLLYALLGGIGVAIPAGPLGSIIMWKRMAYIGDALAHSALFGVALGIWLSIHPILAILSCAILFAFLLAWSEKHHFITNDSMLGIIAHGALALGLVMFSLLENSNINLLHLLFGDILSLSLQDIIIMYIGGGLILLTLLLLWRNILLLVINPDIAHIEGVNTTKLQLLLMLLITIFIALAVKVVGVLLVTSLLIIPAAAARIISDSPERMAVLASFIGILSVIGGLIFSYYYDIPTGPLIVVVALTLYITILAGGLFSSCSKRSSS